MPVNQPAYRSLQDECEAAGVTLVAVSKTRPPGDIMELYDMGHRDFGENYVQELETKYEALPKDIRWHFIGHLQTNKVRAIAPFVHLVHAVDSEKLLHEIDKQGGRLGRVINCLLQVHIAREETKFGMDEEEAGSVAAQERTHAAIVGLMGMASFSTDTGLIRKEFSGLHALFENLRNRSGQGAGHPFQVLSMGMSADYRIAVEEGSTMIRVGSLLFGERDR